MCLNKWNISQKRKREEKGGRKKTCNGRLRKKERERDREGKKNLEKLEAKQKRQTWCYKGFWAEWSEGTGDGWGRCGVLEPSAGLSVHSFTVPLDFKWGGEIWAYSCLMKLETTTLLTLRIFMKSRNSIVVVLRQKECCFAQKLKWCSAVRCYRCWGGVRGREIGFLERWKKPTEKIETRNTALGK